eukprot:553666_1
MMPQSHQNNIVITKDINGGYIGSAEYTCTVSYRLLANDGDSGRLMVKQKIHTGWHYKDTLRFHVNIKYGRGFQISIQKCSIVRAKESTPDSDSGIDTTGVENVVVTFGAKD